MGRTAIRLREAHLAGADGLRLFRRSWLPEEPERVLLLVHGYAEHCGRYEHVGRWFAERDCAVHAYDHRGHGRSDGVRCHVDRFADYLDDLEILLGRVRQEHPGLALTLVGHSMGALVTASLLCERAPALEAAVTSGAALALSDDLPRGRLWAARALRALLPRLHLASGLDPDGLSRDPAVVRAYLEDPLVHRKMTTSLAVELLGAVERTARSAARVEVPLLLLHGEADPLCPVSGSRGFHARLQVAGSGLRVYPNLRHEIFNEPEREQVFQDVLEWLVGGPAGVRA